ncbi:MAG: PAS domain S-box protein [Planctomycetes bacterium]|nr:PAS domain S-box protein [Planctomycetota bacterium]
MAVRLKVLKGERRDECFDLDDVEKVVIGRGVNSTIQIFDQGLSRLHFAIEKREGRFLLKDLESSNGTYLNGRRVREAVLRAGDIISSGETEFRLLDGTEASTTTVLVSKDEHNSTVDYIRRTKPHLDAIASDILSKSPENQGSIQKSLLALTTIYKIGNLIHTERDPRSLFQVILNTILEVIPADRGFLLLLDEKTETFDAVAYHVGEGATADDQLSISRTIVDESIRNGLSTISSDAMSDRRFQAQDSVCLLNIRSVMCVPLEGHDRILGCIYADTLASKGVFTEDQLELMSAIGRQAGIALERAILEDEIRRSEEQHRSFIENSPDAIVETTLEGKVLSFNEQTLRLFRYTREEMNALPVGALYYTTEDRAEVLEQYHVRGYIRDREMELKDSEGSRIHASVSGRLVRDEKTGVHKIESIIRDISKRKELENALKKSEEQYRNTFERTPALIATVDVQGNILDLNRHGCEALGLVSPATGGDALRVNDLFPLPEEMKKMLAEGASFEANDVPVRKKASDSFAYFNVRGAAFRDGSGGISGGVILAEDITRQKELQAQVFQQEKMASVGLLASGIAHEFNNIIASMMGYAQLAGKKENFDFAKLREIVLKQTARGKQIIDSLMSFSRQGQQERTYASVNDILEDSLLLVAKEIEKNRIRLVKEFGEVPRTCVNVGEIQQVFLNMIINAAQAMIDREGTLTIRTLEEEGAVVVIFQDTGGGIAKTNLGKIFQPFFTTKGPSGKSRIPGTGLGLSVSYNLVRKHEGEIIVESEEGIGSVFTIRLPIVLPSPKGATRRITTIRAEAGEPELGMKILVVDDEPAILDVVKGFFEKNEVVTVRSGKQAILEFARRRFDLVFLDISMPGEFNGLETFDRLKTINPQARIVFLTGQAEEERFQPYLAKADGRISKPFSDRDVYQYLRPS